MSYQLLPPRKPGEEERNERVKADTQQRLEATKLLTPQTYSQEEVMEVIETTLRAYMPRYMNDVEVKRIVLQLFHHIPSNLPK